jgi:glycosyltransferase involved in cell wall biosynthesis
MAPLKVLVAVHQFFPRSYHGTERYTLDLATELTRAGHEVVILTTNQAPEDSTGEDVLEYEYNGLRVLAIDLVQNRLVEFAGSYHRPDLNDLFARILLQERPDVVHCTHLLYLGVSFLDVARLTGCPVVLTMTDFFGICWTNKLLTCVGKECAGPDQNSDNCLHDVLGSLSISSREPLVRSGGRIIRWMPFLTPFAELLLKTAPFKRTWYPSLIKGIRNRRGVIEESYQHVDHFIVATSVLEKKYRDSALRNRAITRLPFGITQPSPDEISFLRNRYQELRSTERPLVFGFIGQLARHKGVDLLMRAFVKAPPANTELRIIGNLEQDPVFASELRSIARMHREIKFFPPFPTSEVYSVLGKIDVLILPSVWSENAPLILLNSLASRTLVAVSDVAGMTEFIDPEKTGLIFAAKSLKAIEEMLGRAALLRPKLLDFFGSHPGYKVSPSSYADQVAKIYEQYLTKRSRSWNESSLKRMAASGPARTRPVRWWVLGSVPFGSSSETTFDWNAAISHRVAIERTRDGGFRFKTLARDSFVLLENHCSGKAEWIEVLAKWSAPTSSVVYYAQDREHTLSEDKKILLSIPKESWIRLRFDFGATEPPIQAFRWDLAFNSAGIELQIGA